MFSVNRALVVEGDSSLVAEIVWRLWSLGHRYTVADTQAKACERLQRERYDYILLDHCLPISDALKPNPKAGLNLLKCIRLNVGIPTSALPAIVMSRCRKDMESAVRFIKTGASECIPVPFEEAREALEDKIERILEERSPRLIEEYKQREIQIPLLQVPSLPQPPVSSPPFLEIDIFQELVFCKGQAIDLTARQFKLLLILARSPGSIVRREEIFEALFGPSDPDDDHRPNYGQIDKVKSQLVAAFKAVLGEEIQLITTKAKVGLKLELTEDDIRRIGESQTKPQHISPERKMRIEEINIPVLSQSLYPCQPESPLACSKLSFCDK